MLASTKIPSVIVLYIETALIRKIDGGILDFLWKQETNLYLICSQNWICSHIAVVRIILARIVQRLA